jgi:hypothetical protein
VWILRSSSVKSHTSVYHHRLSRDQTHTLIQQPEPLFRSSSVLAVSLENLMRQRKAVTVDHKAHHDLFAIRALVPRVAPFRLGVAKHLAFKISRRQVIQKNGLLQIEKAPFSLHQRRFNSGPIRMQPIEIAIQGLIRQLIKIYAQNIR